VLRPVHVLQPGDDHHPGLRELAPAGDVGRATAADAAVVAQIYLVFIVARLVALYTALGPVIGHSSRDSRNADLESERGVGDDNGSVRR
jgi:hypothetical protein